MNGEALKQAARDQGFHLAGIAAAATPPHYSEYESWLAKGNQGTMEYMSRQRDLRKSLESVMPGTKSVLVVGLNYNQEPKRSSPRVARYALGRDYHKVVRKKLLAVAKTAEQQTPGLQTRVCVDSAPVLEREFAVMAGIGWYGKNTCVIDSKTGSWFFIGLLLLSEEFAADKPAVGGCGTCRICIDACPTGALVLDDNKPIATLDARKCISYLTIEHKGTFAPDTDLHGWLFGCDVCQEVCPFNNPRESAPQRAKFTDVKDFHAREANFAPDLDRLAEADKEEFAKLYAGTPLMRAGSDRIRRNIRQLGQKP